MNILYDVCTVCMFIALTILKNIFKVLCRVNDMITKFQSINYGDVEDYVKNYIDEYNVLNPLLFRPSIISEEQFNVAVHNELLNMGNTKIPVIHIRNKDNHLNKCIVYAHGNKDDLYKDYDKMHLISKELKMDVIAFDYAGYGYSQKFSKKCTEGSCIESMNVVMEYAKAQYELDDIILFGRSFGCGPVLNYVHTHPTYKGKIILEMPYLSIASIKFKKWAQLIKFMDMFCVMDYIHIINNPIYFVHGLKDPTINIENSFELYKRYSANKVNPHPPLWIQGADHIDYVEVYESTYNARINSISYYGSMNNFIRN